MRGGEAWTGEFEVRRRDGTSFPALVTDSPYVDPSGKLAGIIGTSSDISALKEARDAVALRAAQQTATAALGRFALTADDVAALGAEAERLIAEVVGTERTAVEVVWNAEDEAPFAGQVRVDVVRGGAILLSGPVAASVGQEQREFLDGVANVLQAAAQQHTARAQLEHHATHDRSPGCPIARCSSTGSTWPAPRRAATCSPSPCCSSISTTSSS